MLEHLDILLEKYIGSRQELYYRTIASHGFRSGLNDESPTSFIKPDAQEVYSYGYKLGLMQAISNKGFNDGLNSQPPQLFFQDKDRQEVYNKAYELGTKAALTKMFNEF